jgi:hypothetical protein
MTDDAIAWWKLNETVAGPVVDTQGNHDGVNVNALINQTGKFGKAYSFDGTGDYITVAHATDLDNLMSDVSHPATFCAWVYLTANKRNTIFGKEDQFEISIDPANDLIYLASWGSGDQNIAFTCETGKWYFIVVQFTGIDIGGNLKKLYVDGEYIGPIAGGTRAATTNTLYIGRCSAATERDFGGLIDEIRIYNRILSDAEILGLYHSNAPNFTITTHVSGGYGTHGTVSKVPSQATYLYGDIVAMTANPATGNEFDEWTGDISGSDNPKNLTVTKDEDVTANFDFVEYTLTLTVSPVGKGTITKSPSQTTYHYNDEVILTPTPIAGWGRSGWSDLDSQYPRTVIVTANASYTFKFFHWSRKSRFSEEQKQ